MNMKSKINFKYYNNKDIEIYPCISDSDLDINEKYNENPNNLSLEQMYFYNQYRFTLYEWLFFNKSDDILEINATFGAMTKYFCQKAKKVTVIEFSKKNAQIIDKRLKEFNNLEIFIGNLQDIKIKRKFNYIIVNDVFNLAHLFFHTKNPQKDFIIFLKNLLKPDGQIIFSFHSCAGIKTAKRNKYTEKDPYLNIDKNLEYKIALENLFKNENFNFVKFYYPTISHIITDESMNLYYNITFNCNFKYGIYLIAIGFSEPKRISYFSKITYSETTNVYHNMKTKKDYVQKESFSDNLYKYNFKLSNHYKLLPKYYSYKKNELIKNNIYDINLVPCKYYGNKLLYGFAKGKRLDLMLYEINSNFANRNKVQECINLLQKYKDMIYRLYPNKKLMDFSTKGFENFFGEVEIKNVVCAKNVNIDINVGNVFINDKIYTIIDYDRICPYYIPLDYIFYYGIKVFERKIQDLNIFQYLFKEEELEIFKKIRNAYQNRERDYFTITEEDFK